MAMVDNAFSVAKTNLYRSSVGQPAISAGNNAADSPANYCQNMVNIQTPFLNANQALLDRRPSPVPSVGNNLLTFMANRLSMSYANLNCQDFGLKNPVSVTLNDNGVATAATFDTTQQVAASVTREAGRGGGTGGTAAGSWNRRRCEGEQPGHFAHERRADRLLHAPGEQPTAGPGGVHPGQARHPVRQPGGSAASLSSQLSMCSSRS